MNFYRDIETDNIYSESDLLAMYKAEYAYDMEYSGIPFSRWLGNCMTRNNGCLERVYPFDITVDVSCLDRWLTVKGYSTMDEDAVSALLDARYDQWNDPESYPEAESMCCEEWILEALDELGISYSASYDD